MHEIVNVLQEDGELAGAVAAERREAALRTAPARLLRVPRGAWDAASVADAARGGHGLLVLSGLLMRRVEIDAHFGAELLGPGDPLNPGGGDGQYTSLAVEPSWRVVEALRLAVLDRAWSFRMSPFPEVAIELTARSMRRSRRLSNLLAISQQPRLEPRLHMLLWELADRYGRVGPDGVRVPLPITHELIANLAAARRPSVTTALNRLAASGLVERSEGGWLLHGDPPREAPGRAPALVPIEAARGRHAR
jgi:CRP-like cAMP-binding protein